MLDRAARWLTDNTGAVLLNVAYILLSAAFNWGLMAIPLASEGAGLTVPVKEIAQVSGFVLCVVVSLACSHASASEAPRRLPPVSRRIGMGAALGVVLFVLGTAGLGARLAGQGFPLVIALASFGFGYAVGLVGCLCMASRLSPRRFLALLCSGYLAVFLLYPIISAMVGTIGGVYACLAVIASYVLAEIAAKTPMPAEHVGIKYPSAVDSVPRLVLLCATTSIAYGFCSGRLGIGAQSVGLAVGLAIPAAVVAGALIVSRSRFDSPALFLVTCIMMVAGVLLSLFEGLPAVVVKAVTGISLGALYIQAWLSARMLALDEHRRMAAIAAVPAVVTAGVTSGKAWGANMGSWSGTIAGTVLVLVIVVVMVALLLTKGMPATQKAQRSHPGDVLATPDYGEVQSRSDFLVGSGTERGLTQRELSVFLLLIDGKTTAQISDELFIAHSTVRAHASRVYDKFGVHSREELEQKLAR